MARPRNPKRDESFQLWINSKGEMKLKDIAEQLELSDSQIRKWKNQDNWDEQLNGNVTKSKGNVTKQKQLNKVIKKEPVESELVVSDDNELTDKQRLFVAFYVKSWNATKAYKKAYECGYNTAMVEGSRHLRNPKISAEIIRVRDEITGDALLSKRVLIQKWIDIAFADMTDFVSFGTTQRHERDEEGNILIGEDGEPSTYPISYVNLEDSLEVDGSLITEVKQGRDGISIKLADKMKALDFLTKHMDLLDDLELKQLKVEKARIEVDKLQNGDGSTTQESEVAKMLRSLAGDSD